jgi:uncharacterized membrane-anchored protein
VPGTVGKTRQEFFLRGRLRQDRRTKRLAQRLRAGEIALLDHQDLDWVAAEALLRRGVKAVLNTRSFCSGLFPPAAVHMLLQKKVHLVEELDDSAFNRLKEGDTVTISGGSVFLDGKEVARGRVIGKEECDKLRGESLRRREAIVDDFVKNTLEYAYRERPLVTGNIALPVLRTKFKDRDAVVVIRGKGYREDLWAIKSFLREKKPVLVGVDGGGDALLECGFTPDLIIGDMDSVTDHALSRTREVIVHAYQDGRGTPGRDRLEKLGVDYQVFTAPGTSEDIALLLAYELGAALIVAIGAHSSVSEFLEKGRKGMSSTFLVRLKIGDRLVDAKGVSRLYTSRASGMLLPVVIAAGLMPLLTLAAFSPLVQHLFRLFLFRIRFAP